MYHINDLPSNVILKGDIAVDTEAMGLNNLRDRLCVVQLCDEQGNVHIVHFPKQEYNCPNLVKLLNDDSRQKIFHFARFDVAVLFHYTGAQFKNIFCTKIASKLCRTYTDMHGLKDIVFELLGIKISKQQQQSDWGAPSLSTQQLEYAASDVIYLHQLREKLSSLLKRESRFEIAHEVFACLAVRSKLDVLGWADIDIFAHSS